MEKYRQVITDDGSISYYNNELGDIYHSQVGAYTEALEKFVRPSGILERLGNYSCINVFDVCFGLGYNTKVLMSEVFKHCPGISFNIVAIEIDPNILLKSAEISFAGYPEFLKSFFDEFLHKVYYTTISNQYNKKTFFHHFNEQINFKVYVNDIRQIVRSCDGSYDIILLDPFSPRFAAQLWTVELFKEYYRLLNNNGVLITYSAASAIRGAMQEAGFCIGDTPPVGRKCPGTIAAKNLDLIKFSISEKEKQLLESTAGIPYSDPTYSLSSDEVTVNRTDRQFTSQRKSGNKVRKELFGY